MRTLSLLFHLIVLLTVTACAQPNDIKSQYDTPKMVFKKHVNSSQYEDVPLVLIETLESLKFKDKDFDTGDIAFAISPAEKIKTFSVLAYVEYEDGWVIASQRGEWGGIVFWVDKKGNYEIFRDDHLSPPIDLFADVNINTIVITLGLQNYFGKHSNILEVSRNKGVFSTRLLPLTNYPNTFKQSNGKWRISQGYGQGYYLLHELQEGKRILHAH